jgi:hypothetical protein
MHQPKKNHQVVPYGWIHAQTIVYAMSQSERYLEDIHVAKLYCATSFNRNRFVQGQIAR